MRIFGFNISIHRDAEPVVAKDATQYALSAGLWPDEAVTRLGVKHGLGSEAQLGVRTT
jgi:hypothetical protein